MTVSIIIPVYNKIRYIAAILQQVKEQTFTDYECLLIDDGSTDGSGAVCDEFAAKDHRFQVFHISNGGVSHARNVGLDAAKGKYITFVDADDMVHPDYLQNMYQLMITHDVDMIVSGVEKYWNNRPERIAIHAPFEGIQTMEEILPVFAATQNQTGIFGLCVAKMFSRSIIAGKCFNEQLILGEDFDFYLQIYPNVKKIFFDQNCLYYYLQEAENSSSQISDEKIDYCAQFRISLRYRQFLQDQGSYSGENQKIVDRQISNYLFYALHYCPKQQFRTRFNMLKTLCKQYQVEYSGVSVWQKIVLKLYRCNVPGITAALIDGYHALRKNIGGRS